MTAAGRADWRAAAACQDTDPELFFPVTLAGPGAAQAAAAKQVCARCPARAPCLAFALDHPQAEGIWGGTTGPERRAMHPPRHRPHQVSSTPLTAK